jgi:transcriptional repressor NrdR
MHCPSCGSDRLSVIDTRSEDGAIRRRRECQACGKRFTTVERIEQFLPFVEKKDGRREPFSREKVRTGLIRAFEKRPVGVAQIEQILQSVEQRVSELGVKEIPSKRIGEIVMGLLKGIDVVAYVRFASVYQEFSDLTQFAETIKSLDSEDRA